MVTAEGEGPVTPVRSTERPREGLWARNLVWIPLLHLVIWQCLLDQSISVLPNRFGLGNRGCSLTVGGPAGLRVKTWPSQFGSLLLCTLSSREMDFWCTWRWGPRCAQCDYCDVTLSSTVLFTLRCPIWPIPTLASCALNLALSPGPSARAERASGNILVKFLGSGSCKEFVKCYGTAWARWPSAGSKPWAPVVQLGRTDTRCDAGAPDISAKSSGRLGHVVFPSCLACHLSLSRILHDS